MALSYANISTRVLQILQDTAGATYDATELGYWIEDELKRISRFQPLKVDVIFQVESRDGTDVTGAANKLTDSVKSQFLAADATNEKVVHNITDDTWAVVTARDSASVLSISADIMDASEDYEIYNKRCRNKRQIYIGDMPPYLWVDSVEYPLGTERNFKLLDDVIELEVDDDTILDSDSTLTSLNQVEVLVRFGMAQILSQLTDLAGALTADESTGDTSIALGSMTSAEIIEVGDQFHIVDHRSLYMVAAQATIASAGVVSALSVYPPLEADAASLGVVTFRKSTLSPDMEEVLCQRVAARAMLSNTVTKVASISPGGTGAYERERQWALDILGETTASLRGRVRAKPYKILPRT